MLIIYSSPYNNIVTMYYIVIYIKVFEGEGYNFILFCYLVVVMLLYLSNRKYNEIRRNIHDIVQVYID